MINLLLLIRVVSNQPSFPLGNTIFNIIYLLLLIHPRDDEEDGDRRKEDNTPHDQYWLVHLYCNSTTK